MKTVLVTGASRGLGRAIADDFAANGWRVIATERNSPQVTEDGIKRLPLDLGSEDSVLSLASALDQNGTVIDLLINNAGYKSQGQRRPRLLYVDLQDRPFCARRCRR